MHPTSKKRLRHNKIKNSGILFELLVKQITADVLSNHADSSANRLLRTFFAENTALGKERKLYETLLKEKTKSDERANQLLEIVLRERRKISNKELAEQKYNLIKEIRGLYPIDDFFKGAVDQYKEMASIYKIFEDCSNTFDYVDTQELFQARTCLLEHITKTKKTTIAKPSEEKDKLMEFYGKQSEDIRLLSFKIATDQFNEKYADLDVDQKILLREYIRSISNTNSLRTHVDNEVDKIKKELGNLVTRIKEPTTRIKVCETINQLDNIKGGASKVVKDSHVTALLSCYELIKEIKSNILL